MFVWCGYDSGFWGAQGRCEAEMPEGKERFAQGKWARWRMISQWVKGRFRRAIVGEYVAGFRMARERLWWPGSEPISLTERYE